MPAAQWNGKLLAAGLRDGYATAMTDTGHEGSCCLPGGDSARFAMGHPEKLIDFGYRLVHEMAVAAKAMVNELWPVGDRQRGVA